MMEKNKKIYLDNNATTPLAPEVLDAVVSALSEFGNPSSVHSLGQKAKALIENAREKIASFFAVRPQEVIFTSGGTESCNMLIRGIIGQKPYGHIITTNIEHAAVYNTVKALEAAGCKATYLACGLAGFVTKEMMEEYIQPDTRLITVMSVNNETGVKTDIKSIAELAKERNIPLVVDSISQLGKELFAIDEGISAMAFSGHKIHAPKGAGFVIVRKNCQLTSSITGGHQEYEKRAGTENVPAIAGLGVAIDLLKETLPQAQTKMATLRDYFEEELIARLQYIEVNGVAMRNANTSNLAFADVEGEVLLRLLDLEGVMASHGSACASGALEPSRILLNMGLSRKKAASSLRFSLSRYTTEDEIEEAIGIIVHCVERLRGMN